MPGSKQLPEIYSRSIVNLETGLSSYRRILTSVYAPTQTCSSALRIVRRQHLSPLDRMLELGSPFPCPSCSVGVDKANCGYRQRQFRILRDTRYHKVEPSTCFLSVCTTRVFICVCLPKTGPGSGARPRASSDDVFSTFPPKRVA